MQNTMVRRRRQKNRKREIAAEQCHARSNCRDLPEHSRTKTNPIERLTIPSQCVFVSGARGNELVRHRRHGPTRQLLELQQAQNIPAIDVGGHVREYLAVLNVRPTGS
jgi:hypothetical protein